MTSSDSTEILRSTSKGGVQLSSTFWSQFVFVYALGLRVNCRDIWVNLKLRFEVHHTFQITSLHFSTSAPESRQFSILHCPDLLGFSRGHLTCGSEHPPLQTCSFFEECSLVSPSGASWAGSQNPPLSPGGGVVFVHHFPCQFIHCALLSLGSDGRAIIFFGNFKNSWVLLTIGVSPPLIVVPLFHLPCSYHLLGNL